MSVESIINDLRGLAVTGSLHRLSQGYWGRRDDPAGSDTAAGLQLDAEARREVLLTVPFVNVSIEVQPVLKPPRVAPQSSTCIHGVQCADGSI